MSTTPFELSAGVSPPGKPGKAAVRGWRAVTLTLAAGFFLEAIFAGAMLSGAGWARKAHAMAAGLLITAALLAGLWALVVLRRFPPGLRLGLTLTALAVVAAAQAMVGALTAKGANFAWLHIPLGVALVGLAGQTAAGARRLGAP